MIRSFLTSCRRTDINPMISDQTIQIRRQYRLKIPDAIIVASAVVQHIPLVSADTQLSRVANLALITDILS